MYLKYVQSLCLSFSTADHIVKIFIIFGCQVSHHPMIIACHCEGRGWKFYGDSNLKSKFWGRSIQLDPVGVLTLEFDDGEILQWSKVWTWRLIYCLVCARFLSEHELFSARLQLPFTTSYWESFTVITTVQCEYRENMNFNVSWNLRSSLSLTEILTRYFFFFILILVNLIVDWQHISLVCGSN